MLYEHQKQAIEFLERHNRRGVLAMEMGLGKTIVALHFLAQAKSGLVVCPAFLVENWASEFEKFHKIKPSIIRSKKTIEHNDDRYIVGSYDLVSAMIKGGHYFRQEFVVFDESHKLKSYTTQRYKTLRILKREKNILLLSGTPVINSPLEIHPQIALVDKSWNFEHSQWFRNRYVIWRETRYADFPVGTKNLEELHSSLDKYMFRVRSEDVLDMPDLIRDNITIEAYKGEVGARESIREAFRQEGKFAGLVALNEYKKKISKHKADWFIHKFHKENIDRFEGQKVLVFCQYRDTVHYLQGQLGGLAITGGIQPQKRVEKIEDFKNDPNPYIFATLPSLQEGANLGWIEYLYFLDLAWTPASHAQGEGRLRRITRKGKVIANYIIAKGSIDDFLAEKLNNKTDIVGSVVDNTKLEFLSQLV
jgi:SNF2 family DNA or RNA helicase